MDSSLRRLTKKMPPPSDPPNRQVDWARLEAGIRLSYPDSFKEFVGVYGSSVWCEHVTPVYSTAKTDAEVRSFLRLVKDKLKPLKSNMYSEKFEAEDVPLYPDTGGLFPFMIDYSSSLYCWRTKQEDPTAWAVNCWFTGQLVRVGKITISGMILKWLERKPEMMALWGDINDLPADQIKLT